MGFSTNIFELQQKKNITIDLIGAKLPTPKDIFFRAKQKEIFEQYESARIFLRETEIDDWSHWFTGANPEYHEVFKLTFMEIMFESALMYYNIIVDLSWTLCYVSAEYVLYQKGKAIKTNDLMNIEDAYSALRKVENLVTNPNSEGNPFEYLKNMCPEFKDSIDLIVDFWKEFSDTDTRKLYNFIKHKGKPVCEEIEKFRGHKLFDLSINNESIPSNVRDVQKVINLKNSIRQLKHFDDEILFPYIKKLFELLELAVEPSPLVF